MLKRLPCVAAVLVFCAASRNVSADEVQIRRYEVIVAAPNTSTPVQGDVILLDTATGQNWLLTRAPFMTWTPLGFWAGEGKHNVPLPPSPDVIPYWPPLTPVP
jgi:hypothetical protein